MFYVHNVKGLMIRPRFSKVVNLNIVVENGAYPFPKEFDLTSKTDVYMGYYNMTYSNPPVSVTEANEAYLSDNFQNLDKNGKVTMDRETWIRLGPIFFPAFKDLNYVISELHEEGDDVIVSGHLEGTHTGDLDLSAMGLGVIPATWKKVVWPEGSLAWKIKNDKIVSAKNLVVADAMGALLEQLGVKPPPA